MSSILKTENITFKYKDNTSEKLDDKLILDNINLSIETGSFVAILGHNGSGKSTLAKHFNAILLPEGGKVYVDNIDTSDEERLFDVRQRVGMVFQNPDNQIVATIVEEDVAFALENLGVEPKEIRERVDSALKTVGMYEYKDRAPSQLSGGQKQKIAIAGIIAMRPSCIVLDEPTAMLDPKGRKDVLATIDILRKEYNITVVLITHYMNEAAQADRVVVMDNGKPILDGTPREVFPNVDMLYKVGLDVPQATELSYKLRLAGVNISKDILTVDECVSAILDIYK